MNDAVSEPPQEVSYSITYQMIVGPVYNLDFTGPGVLTIRAAGPSYVFKGKPRAFFVGRRPTELEFGPDDIWNVVVTGRRISFHTTLGEAGKKKQPFVFFCADAAEARNVASLLPTRQDQDFTASREFTQRLDGLRDAQSPWTSATNIIIALNVLMFVLMGNLGAGWFDVDSMKPYLLFGASNGAATTDGEWWRLLTSMFVHYGVLHLLCNMWALYEAGHFLEKLLGRWLYTLTYLGSGLAGGFLSIAWHGDKVWSAGASGAVFGVYGAILGYMLREKQALPPGIYKPMMKSTLTFAGYNILYGLRAGVDNSAHVGGLAGGLILGWLLALPVDREVRLGQAKKKLQLGLGALAVMIAAGVLLTPRFDYSIRDELTWQETNKDFVAKEPALSQRQDQGVAALKNGGNAAELAGWMAMELVPFYEQWNSRITALRLESGRQTARKRDALNNILQLRIASFQHLITGLRANNPEAVDQYFREDAKVSQAIEKWQKAKAPSGS